MVVSVEYVGGSWFELVDGDIVWPFTLEFDSGSCHAWVVDVFGCPVAHLGWRDITRDRIAVLAASYFKEGRDG